ncbi:helix-turn-helix transcriptional regulator [Macrococcus equi]|uniref:helix-turn-helix transcriptional regulator n=1 Tax=Macrococcus equi TaxID=3395462 RepID=UPI0039BE6D1E
MKYKDKKKSLAILELLQKLMDSDILSRQEIFDIIGNTQNQNLQRYIKDLSTFIENGLLSSPDSNSSYLFSLKNIDAYDEYFEDDDLNTLLLEDFNDEEQNEILKHKINIYDLVPDKSTKKITNDDSTPYIQSYNNRAYFSLRNYEKLNKKHVLVLLKLLLDSRSLNYNETIEVTNELLKNLSNEDRKKVAYSIRSEIHKYKQTVMATSLIDLIWKLNDFIINRDVLIINYKNVENEPRIITIAPQYITQDEFYYYMIGYINENETRTLRIDRIESIEVVTNTIDKKKYKPKVIKRESELGEYKNRTPLMFYGDNDAITLEYYGKSPEALLDRFPAHEDKGYKNNDRNCRIFTIYTSGEGVYMWLLSQGDDIKVVSPLAVQKKLKEKLRSALERY